MQKGFCSGDARSTIFHLQSDPDTWICICRNRYLLIKENLLPGKITIKIPVIRDGSFRLSTTCLVLSYGILRKCLCQTSQQSFHLSEKRLCLWCFMCTHIGPAMWKTSLAPSASLQTAVWYNIKAKTFSACWIGNLRSVNYFGYWVLIFQH